VEDGVTATVGPAVTAMAAEADALQKAVLRPVTVYTIPADGVAITVEPFVLLNPVAGVHVYDTPPLATSVTLLPAQTVELAGETVIEGEGMIPTDRQEGGP
jgi:hypothetical protein